MAVSKNKRKNGKKVKPYSELRIQQERFLANRRREFMRIAPALMSSCLGNNEL